MEEASNSWPKHAADSHVAKSQHSSPSPPPTSSSSGKYCSPFAALE